MVDPSSLITSMFFQWFVAGLGLCAAYGLCRLLVYGVKRAFNLSD